MGNNRVQSCRHRLRAAGFSRIAGCYYLTNLAAFRSKSRIFYSCSSMVFLRTEDFNLGKCFDLSLSMTSMKIRVPGVDLILDRSQILSSGFKRFSASTDAQSVCRRRRLCHAADAIYKDFPSSGICRVTRNNLRSTNAKELQHARAWRGDRELRQIHDPTQGYGVLGVMKNGYGPTSWVAHPPDMALVAGE